MNKDEIKAAQNLIDTPITPENLKPAEPVFPATDSNSGTVCRHCKQQIIFDNPLGWITAKLRDILCFTETSRNPRQGGHEPAPAEQPLEQQEEAFGNAVAEAFKVSASPAEGPRQMSKVEVENLAAYNADKYHKVAAQTSPDAAINWQDLYQRTEDALLALRIELGGKDFKTSALDHITSIRYLLKPSPDAAKVEEIAREIVYEFDNKLGMEGTEPAIKAIAAILRPYFPQVSASELCDEFVAHLIAGASWFTCALPKGHKEEGHRAAGNCLAHGRYLGEPNAPPRCPKWPECIKGAFNPHREGIHIEDPVDAGLAGEATDGPLDRIREDIDDAILGLQSGWPAADVIAILRECLGSFLAPAAPEGAAPPDTIKADNLFGIYCSGNPLSVPTTPAIYWEGWQRLADWLNQRAVGEVAELRAKLDYWNRQAFKEYKRAEAAEAQLKAAREAEVAFGSWLVDRLNGAANKPEEAGLRMALNEWSGFPVAPETKEKA